MLYTIRRNGRILGTTALDFYQLLHGQHSGWLHPAPDARELLDAVSIKSAYVRTWMLRNDVREDGQPLTEPEFLTSKRCAAITAAVAERLHMVLTLHREDGSELATREIVLQDRMPGEPPGIDELDLDDEELDEQQLAEIDAAVAHDLEIINGWDLEQSEWTSADQEAFEQLIEARWNEAEESRYQVHLRLANADDLPSDLVWHRKFQEDAP